MFIEMWRFLPERKFVGNFIVVDGRVETDTPRIQDFLDCRRYQNPDLEGEALLAKMQGWTNGYSYTTKVKNGLPLRLV